MNPLLSRDFRMPFDQVKPEHVLPGIEEAVKGAQEEVERIAGASAERTYENTVAALDAAVERVERAVTIAAHLMSVANSPELREAYGEAIPVFSAFFAQLPLNLGLYRAIREYAETPGAQELDPVRARRLEKLLDEFRRSGAELPDAERARVQEIQTELQSLATDFSNTLLDATNAFELHLTDEDDLAGLPGSARSQARAAAQEKGLEGWRFTLHGPSYLAFMRNSERRDLRRRMYEAYSNRASGGELDNRPRIARILALRRELAGLLGYRDFADLRLETNMIGDGTRATEFERDLYQKTLPYWQAEMDELQKFARTELGLDELRPWDLSFAMERLQRSRFEFDSEELRPYFPLPHVLEGLFEVCRRLFGITVTEVPNEAVWHEDVRYYEMHAQDGRHLGSFYAAYYPREPKRGGAWMNSFVSGEPQPDGTLAPHLGLIVTNSTPPEEGKPALLTHREVQTLFHEFGHLIHHLLSEVELPAIAGTNVPRDWVEVPSQFLENWTWEREALDLFARHVDTGEPIPEELFRKLHASRTFMEGYAQMRQLSFGTVDLALHIDFDPESGEDPLEFGNRVRERFHLRPEDAHDGFLCGFGHIFSSGYAASYYSYKWSEMLEADAFTRFRENGLFDRETGQRFAQSILTKGDSIDPAQQFRDFMGRDPDPEALLRRNLGAQPVGS